MTVRELAEEVNKRGSYFRRDGSPVEPNQSRPTKNYAKLFEKNGPRVRLRGSTEDWNVVTFRDDDAGFHNWLDEHPDGFFVNAKRNPKPNYLVLHKSDCPHFDRSPVNWTKDYIKTCSGQRDELSAGQKKASAARSHSAGTASARPCLFFGRLAAGQAWTPAPRL